MPFDGNEADGGTASGFLSRFRDAIGQPFTAPVSWGKLALIVGFIIAVTIGWRQVILYATGDK